MSAAPKVKAAREYAESAAGLLNTIVEASRDVAELDEEQRLQMAAMGGFRDHNENQRWRRELALTYALTAIALNFTEAALDEGVPPIPEPDERREGFR